MVFSDRMDASPLITAVEQLMGPITDMYRQQVKARSESIKPQPVSVRQYETAVYGFRDQRLPGEVKGVSTLLVESLDAFEAGRSEERRVGKECRSRWSPYHLKKKKKEREV